MKTVTLSSKGQIAIPKEIRALLNLNGGDSLAYEIENGKIILEPVIGVPRSQAWFWTQEIQEKMASSEQDFRSGRFTHYENVDVLLTDLKDE